MRVMSEDRIVPASLTTPKIKERESVSRTVHCVGRDTNAAVLPADLATINLKLDLNLTLACSSTVLF